MINDIILVDVTTQHLFMFSVPSVILDTKEWVSYIVLLPLSFTPGCEAQHCFDSKHYPIDTDNRSYPMQRAKKYACNLDW
mmetsp:Transcript_25567/g.70360  ORF Transcript_25567/g.70360 Transcript_25567/m.70360 type:complete len:80 (-) Transcript_25567:535-774(-)